MWPAAMAVAVAGLFAGSVDALSAPEHAQVVAAFTDRRIAESSGLVVAGDRWVTINDSGDDGRVFVVDPTTGDTTREIRFADDVVDTEALAPESDTAVWVGDIGDNRGRRDHITLYRVPLDGGDATAIDLVYPDGARDAETLLRDPATGEMYLVSKGILGGSFYRVPTSGPQPRTLERLGGAPSIATDGTFLDADTVLVRNYGSAYLIAWPSGERVGQFTLPQQPQGESVAVDADGTVLIGSEGVHAEVLRVRIPEDLATPATQSTTATGTPTPSPSAVASSAAPTDPSEQSPTRSGETSDSAPGWQAARWLLPLGVALTVGLAVGLGITVTRSRRPR